MNNNNTRSQRNSISPIDGPRKSHIVIRSFVYSKSPSPAPTRATNTPNTSQVNLNKSILRDPGFSFLNNSVLTLPQRRVFQAKRQDFKANYNNILIS